MRWLMAGAGLGSALMIVLASTRPAAAVPAWGRKYGVECANCHVAGFRLTKMGQDFLRSGHRMEGGEAKQTLSDHASFAFKDRFSWSKTKQENDVITEQRNTFEQHAFSI